MKSLKPVAVTSAAVASALLLASCSAGQITQTSSQVAAIDGSYGRSAHGEIVVTDVTVLLEQNGQAALKFTATNQDPAKKPHELVSASVDGTQVQMSPSPRDLDSNCNIVATSAEGLETIPDADADTGCIQYIATSLPNQNFAYGGTVPVTFEFDSTSVDMKATVAAPVLQSGTSDRADDTKPTGESTQSH